MGTPPAIVNACTNRSSGQWISDDPFMAGIIADAAGSSNIQELA